MPGQGGTNHINEQRPFYWSSLFRNENFEVVDLLREMIWDDVRIPYWYRQNILLFFNVTTKGDCSKDTGLSHHAALALCRILVV